MHVLLDENIPHRLRRLFAADVDVFTVSYLGWQGKKNGELLRDAIKDGFDVFITTDQGIPHQHNFKEINIGLILLEAQSNRYADLAPLMDEVNEAVKTLKAGEVIRIKA